MKINFIPKNKKWFTHKPSALPIYGYGAAMAGVGIASGIVTGQPLTGMAGTGMALSATGGLVGATIAIRNLMRFQEKKRQKGKKK
jgi:hypothetical protein